MYQLFDKEDYYGNIEYKLIINNNNKNNLLTQFFFRLEEGNGFCIYILGIDDNGNLLLSDFKVLYKNIISLINLVKQYATYKILICKKNNYIYAIISFYNHNFKNIYHNITHFINL